MNDFNTEIFCQLLGGGGMERKLHHDFKCLYQELAGWFTLVIHPVLCLAVAVSRYFMEMYQRFRVDLHSGKFPPYLQCKDLALSYTVKANTLS